MKITKVENEKVEELKKEFVVCGHDLLGVYRTSSGLFVLISNDFTKDGHIRHISASHHQRLPTYYEIKELRYTLCGDVKYMAMIFPPVEQFVNIHPNCLHLYEIKGQDDLLGLL